MFLSSKAGFIAKTFLFALAVIALVVILGLFGRMPMLGPESAETFVNEQLKKLEQVDPSAAQILQRLRDQQGAAGLAPAMKVVEANAGNEMSALREMASRSQEGKTPYEVQLSALAKQYVNLSDAKEAEAFFYSHATACQMLTHDQSGQAMTYYLNQLREAAHNPTAWRIIRDDPIALLMWKQLVAEPNLLHYYENEREWLAEILADLETVQLESEQGLNTVSLSEDSYAEAVRTAMKYHPLPMKAVKELNLGSLGFTVFMAFGPIIQRAVNDYGLPLDETLDVLFINGDRMGLSGSEPERNRQADEHARQLVHTKKNRPRVWEYARSHPLALRFNTDVPAYADQLLEKYGANDVCAFLYTSYEKEIVPAAAALATYGDLGFYILKTYESDPRLKAYLVDPKVGMLVVPFLTRFGNVGFDKLDDDPAWVTRFFNPDGKPRKDDWEWIQAVPIVGAPVFLVNNLVKGHPSEWSEWGWAALDVADGALLVASFGGSGGITAAKQAAKGGGQAALEVMTKQEAKLVARGAAEIAAKNAGKGIPGIAVRQVERSALKQIALGGGRMLLGTGKFIVIAFRRVGKIADSAFDGARQLKKAWVSVPSAPKRWMYRSLLAVGMVITIHERTIPGLPKVGEAIGTEVGKLIHNTALAIANAFMAAFRESFGWTQTLAYWVGYVACCLALLLLAWQLRPWNRPRLQAI